MYIYIQFILSLLGLKLCKIYLIVLDLKFIQGVFIKYLIKIFASSQLNMNISNNSVEFVLEHIKRVLIVGVQIER